MLKRTVSPEELVTAPNKMSYSEINNNVDSSKVRKKSLFSWTCYDKSPRNNQNSSEELLSVSPESKRQSIKESDSHELKKKIFNVMNSPPMQIFSALLLLLSLFMSDAFILGNAPDSMNNALWGTMSVILGIFLVEMTIMSFVEDGYFLSFFFWLDLIGTLSLILDIGWITDAFIPSGAINAQGSVLRAVRAARLAARYGRLMRLLKLLRLMYYIPCFNNNKDAGEPTMNAVKKISTNLSQELSLRVAFLVILLVIVVPFLGVTVIDYSENAWLDNMKMIGKNYTTNLFDVQNMARKCNNFYGPKPTALLYFELNSPYIPSPYVYTSSYPSIYSVLKETNTYIYSSQFKLTNLTIYRTGSPFGAKYLSTHPGNSFTFESILHMDYTNVNKQSSMFSIITIVMVIVLLFVFTASFNNSVNRLVVIPLEKMMTTLRNSAMILLKSMQSYEQEKVANEKKGELEKIDEEEEEDFESEMLEKIVEKLSRVVKHMMAANNGGPSIEVDGNIDKTTANWLNESYANNSSTVTKRGENDINVMEMQHVMTTSGENVSTIIDRETLNSWNFDVLQYNHDELIEIMNYQFSSLNLLDQFQIPSFLFKSFLKELGSRYINSNTYHNFHHGCDVCHTSFRLVTTSHLTHVLSSLEVFSLLVAAIGHDVGHPGLNNVYLVKAKHSLALLHNDVSPLENMHCFVLYEVLGKSDHNIFVNLTEAQWREARKIIIKVILGTDMSHHFEQISKSQIFFEVNGDDFKEFYTSQKDEVNCFSEEKNRFFMMELILHCSDISNPFKPFSICAKWADLVVEEFCLQGDQEKSEGLEISPMCDRTAINLCNMQMGFIEFVVTPLIIAFIKILPPVNEIGDNLLNNFLSWGEKRKGDIEKDALIVDKVEEIKKLDERLKKFKEKMSFLTDVKSISTRKRISFVGK